MDSGPQSPQYPGDINQALIELGSTVCKVREPNCDSCPLQMSCNAYQNSRLTAEEKVLDGSGFFCWLNNFPVELCCGYRRRLPNL